MSWGCKNFDKNFAPVWNVPFAKILPQFGRFHLGFEIARILTKILPQFGMFPCYGVAKILTKIFAPVWNVRSSFNIIVGSVVLPMSI